MKNNLLYIIVLLLFTSCSTTRNIPDDDQLFVGLTKIEYKNYEANNNFVSTQEEIEAALATAPNGALFGSSFYRTPFPYGLWIWNAFSDKKSDAAKWITKNFGKQPVLMSWINPELRVSVAQSLLRNHGYFRGKVSYQKLEQRNPKKAKIGYTVDLGHLYTYDSIAYMGFPKEADSLLVTTKSQAKIHKNDAFTTASLDAERMRLSTLFRNNGYYYYQAGYASYIADTTLVPGKVQLQLQLADNIPAKAKHKWYMGKVDVTLKRTFMEDAGDTIVRKFLTIRFNGKKPPIRPSVILRDMKLRPRQAYSYDNYQESVNNLNAMGLFSMTDFQFTPRDSTLECDTLDLALNCVLDKPYDFYIETNFVDRMIGRMGPELKMGIVKRNAFRGGEKVDVNLHGSYEWATSGGANMDSYEYGVDASVEFPRLIVPFYNFDRLRRTPDGKIRPRLFYTTPTTTAKASTNIIQRPGYYKMHVVSGEWTYRWQTSAYSTHEFSPLTLKYQYMNNRTSRFDSILTSNPYLMTTMSDFLIPQMRYSYIYSSPVGSINPVRWQTTISESGNLLSLALMPFGRKWNEQGKKLFKTIYSQYVKIETDLTKTWRINNSSHLVGHVNAGYVHSFGNTDVTPFSEMFYVGGANSIRAFPVRTVGPGAFPYQSKAYSYLMQNGEIKLVANLEYRKRLFGSLYGAAFLDVGNVWLTKDDELSAIPSTDNTSMKFKFSKIFEQLAVGTGIGIRYNLDFLVLRLDWGIGLHLPYKTSKGGFYNINSFKDAQTLNFAIGYPF